MNMMTITPAAPALADDLITGADAIAKFLWGPGADAQRVYNMRRKRGAPIFMFGRQLCARRSKLIAWIAELEKAAAAE